jgi:hypothetical protein
MKILVEVSHTAQNDVRTGIQAVVRGLLAGLRQAGANFQTVRWSGWRNAFVPLDRYRNQALGIPDVSERQRSPNEIDEAWLLLPEVIYGPKLFRMIAHARKHRMRIAAIFHDAIPVTHPELVRRRCRCYSCGFRLGSGAVSPFS